MKRRTCFIWLLSSLIFIQTLAVSLHAASYWSYRNNTIFWNGNWLVGKDMGRFVFYAYAFMFEPLEGNQVNLTSMKGYQEILYRQPESDEARLRKIRFEANLGENSYVWIEFGKNREAGKAWRVSRNTDYPDGYYEFDRDGKATLKETFDLVIEGPRNEIECTFKDRETSLYVNGNLVRTVRQETDREGYFGFRGSGTLHGDVVLKDIRFDLFNPGNPGEAWSVHEDFSSRHSARKAFLAALPYIGLLVLLRLGKQYALACSFGANTLRFHAVDNGIFLFPFIAGSLVPVIPSGGHLPAMYLVAEWLSTCYVLTRARRGAMSVRQGTAVSGILFLAVIISLTAVFSIRHGSTLMSLSETIRSKSRRNIHEDAYLLRPGQEQLSGTTKTEEDLSVRLGSAFFFPGAYRTQHLEAEFSLAADDTLDIVFNQQSYGTRGDPDGEYLPFQRRLLRLSSHRRVQSGLSTETGVRPAPFIELNGEIHTDRANSIVLNQFDSHLQVVLNGAVTEIPGYGALGYGETGFLSYQKTPTTIHRARIEPSRALSTSVFPRIAFAGLIALAWFVLMFYFHLASSAGLFPSALLSTVILFPVFVLLAASIPFSSATILFLSSLWFSWLRIFVLGTAGLLICFIVSLRDRMRHPALWFNVAVALFALGLCSVAWGYLPEEHFLKVRFGAGSVTPTLSKKKSRGPESPWYADNGKIGANTFIWKQQFGGKECPLEKKDDEIRVFVMGGSQAWGSGAASTDEMFSELIQKTLQARGLNVTVYNAGINGARIHKLDIFYHQVVRRFKPDVLLLSYGVNDSAGLYRFHGKPVLARKIDNFAGKLENIIRTCEEEGTKVVLSLSATSRENPVRPNKEYYAKLEQIAGDHEIPLVRSYEFIAEYEKDQMVWWDMAHFAPPGHNALANLLAPVVEEAVVSKMIH